MWFFQSIIGVAMVCVSMKDFYFLPELHGDKRCRLPKRSRSGEPSRETSPPVRVPKIRLKPPACVSGRTLCFCWSYTSNYSESLEDLWLRVLAPTHGKDDEISQMFFFIFRVVCQILLPNRVLTIGTRPVTASSSRVDLFSRSIYFRPAGCPGIGRGPKPTKPKPRKS